MTESGLRERRFRAVTPVLARECRLCWRMVVLEPQHIEATAQHVYVRCPHCSGSFPIRHDDIDAFAGNEASAAS